MSILACTFIHYLPFIIELFEIIDFYAIPLKFGRFYNCRKMRVDANQGVEGTVVRPTSNTILEWLLEPNHNKLILIR
jgi:hypothetical protein